MPLPMMARIFLRRLKRLLCVVAVAEPRASATRTAQILNSGIRLVGSSAGMVSVLAALLPPQ